MIRPRDREIRIVQRPCRAKGATAPWNALRSDCIDRNVLQFGGAGTNGRVTVRAHHRILVDAGPPGYMGTNSSPQQRVHRRTACVFEQSSKIRRDAGAPSG